MFHLPSYILAVIVFSLIVLFNWFGYCFKKNQLDKHPGEIRESMGAVEGAILGVLSLLMGFTFSVAISKFEQQRKLIAEEANHIGTAVLRCDMYPDSVRTTLRAGFKEYIETRIAYFNAGNDEDKVTQELRKATVISDRIWQRAAQQSQDRETIVRSAQMIPALNNMIDIVTTRDAERISRVPSLVLWVLLLLTLVVAFVLGTDYDGKKKRNKLIILSYAIVLTITLNLIIELNRPRSGLINLNAVEEKIVELRDLVK